MDKIYIKKKKKLKKKKKKNKNKKTKPGAQNNQGGVICFVAKPVVNLSYYWYWGLEFKLPGVFLFTPITLHFKQHNLASGFR